MHSTGSPTFVPTKICFLRNLDFFILRKQIYFYNNIEVKVNIGLLSENLPKNYEATIY
jgi:hypothetical protein